MVTGSKVSSNFGCVFCTNRFSMMLGGPHPVSTMQAMLTPVSGSITVSMIVYDCVGVVSGSLSTA